MKVLRPKGGFTLIELLVVILILAILMAIALPLYLRAVRDSQRQTCRSNMQTIANAAQAWKVRNPAHTYPPDYATLFTDPLGGAATPTNLDLVLPGPQCPADAATGDADYVITPNPDETITITCADAAFHNDIPGAPGHGFIPGVDSQ